MSDESPKNTRSIRTFNTTVVLRAIHRKGACSRTDLTRITRLSPATVSRIVGQLLDLGVVYEKRHGESTGGRKPIILRLNYTKLYVIGVQLHRTSAAVAMADLKGTLLHTRVYRPWALEPTLLIKELAHEIEALLATSGVDREEHLLGVGLAISGVVNGETGTMMQSINLGWRNVPIAGELEQILKLPVFVENDANAGALAETWFGAARGTENLLYLKTEAGVGAGVILSQRLVTGPRGMAGEIGHIPLIEDGYRCRCGQQGCLETYVYLPDVLARYEERTGEQIEKASFFSHEKAQDPIVRELIAEAEKALTLALSLPSALLDLDSVIIGGVWGEVDEFCERIQAQCWKHAARTGLNKRVTIKASGMGEQSDLLGAVGLVIDHYLSPPRALSETGVLWDTKATEP